MRVTKTIRAYIRENVEKKLAIKYAPLKERKDTALNAKKELIEQAKEEAIKIVKKVLEEAVSNKALVYNEEMVDRVFNYCNLPNCLDLNRELYYESKMRDEVDKITSDIVVELELGGNKADLDRMLSEI